MSASARASLTFYVVLGFLHSAYCEPRCPQDAITGRRNMCYIVDALKDGWASNSTWDEQFAHARKTCSVNYGGDLASIHDRETDHIIASLARNDPVFFGASLIPGGEMYAASAWTWSDGTLFDYTNWEIGCPEAANVGQPVAYMAQNGTWCNKSSLLYLFVCEFLATPSSTETVTSGTKETVIIASSAFAVFFMVSLVLILMYFRKREEAHAAMCSLWKRAKCVKYMWRTRNPIDAFHQTMPPEVESPVERKPGMDVAQEDACSQQTYCSIDADTFSRQVPRDLESINYDANIILATRPGSLEPIRQSSSIDGDGAVPQSDVASPHESSMMSGREKGKNAVEPQADFEPNATLSFARQIARISGKHDVEPRCMPAEDLEISNEVVRRGAFATFFKAMLIKKREEDRLSTKDKSAVEVAVKVHHGEIDERSRNDAKMEVALMHTIGTNAHVLHLIGYSYQGDRQILIFEYCSRGDLLAWLRTNLRDFKEEIQSKNESLQTHPYSNTKLSLVDLTSFCWQISDGMSFLSSKGYIHRDLAARNILLTSEMVVKIAGFGLCRHTYEDTCAAYRDAELPVRWTAPECLSVQLCSAQSDVWSYGVLLYEIFSAGGLPYEDISPLDILRWLDKGLRLEQPVLCPADVYQIMLQCWRAEPAHRPTFAQLGRYFSTCLEYLSKGYGYVSLSTST